MDINEAIKDLQALKIHRYRRMWRSFMEKYDCQVICELGVFNGDNFDRMIQHGPLVAVAVDSWIDDGIIARNDSGYSQDRLDKQYESFKSRMADNPAVQIHRAYTFDIAKEYPDEYFDLIYVDADHTFEGCLKDVECWYPKVKSGRFFTGDDYTNSTAPKTGVKFGVIKAVNQFANANGLTVHEMAGRGWVIVKP